MSGSLNGCDLTLALDFITSRMGIELPSTNYNIFYSFLTNQLQKYSFTCEKYLDYIDRNIEEYNKFVDTVTINETYFFREEKHFFILKNSIFPCLAEKREPLNIWSAACSTGEEAISLYLIAEEVFSTKIKFKVHGTDINNNVLLSFKNGRYRENSFREDGKIFHKLIKDKSGYREQIYTVDREVVEDIIRMNINLFNLNKCFSEHLFNVVFLRNTLIYFNDENRKNIINSVIENIKPGGFLFLSATEMPLISHSDLRLIEKDGSYYFQKKTLKEKSREDSISESFLDTFKDDYKTVNISVNPIEKSIYCEKISSKLILEYAGNKINNRIFSLANNPNYKLALTLLRIIYKINSSNIDKAVSLLDEMGGHLGENQIIFYLRGYTSLMVGEKEKALVNFKKTLSIDPEFWPAAFFISSILIEQKSERSRKYLRICISGIKEYIYCNSYLYQIFLEGFNGKYFLRICEQWLTKWG